MALHGDQSGGCVEQSLGCSGESVADERYLSEVRLRETGEDLQESLGREGGEGGHDRWVTVEVESGCSGGGVEVERRRRAGFSAVGYILYHT